MLKSLYSGVSGMGANQTKLDVIGNNIANASTTSFKGSRVRFQDALSQTIVDANVPTANQGGTNAAQLGSGVELAGIDTIMEQGPIQNTGRNLDAAIDGEGYFVVGSGPAIFGDNVITVNQAAGQHGVDAGSLAQNGMNLMYTRDGAFTLDNEGNLLSSDGLRIMGYSLTNDNSVTAPTSQKPNAVIAGGFNFQFGPGEALNGYTVVLGKIGAGTLPTASVDTANKRIILNGDFSDDGKISPALAQTAINDALSSSGIAQTVSVMGTSNPIYGTSSDNAIGGVNPKSPASVSTGGFNFEFNQGSQLNGYTIKLGTVAAGTATSANIDTTDKVITINGDFTTVGAINDSQIQTALLNAIQTAQAQTTNPLPAGASITVSGSPVNITASQEITDGKLTYRGMNFTFTDSAGNQQLNGYKIQLGTIFPGTAPSATIDSTNKIITVNGDMNSMTDFKFQTAIQDAHLSTDTDPVTVNIGEKGLFGPFSVNISDSSTTPTHTSYKIQLGANTAGQELGAAYDAATSTITINGDLSLLNNLTSTQLQNLIQYGDVNGGSSILPTNVTANVTGAQITAVNITNVGTVTEETTVSTNGTAQKFGSSSISFSSSGAPTHASYTIQLGTTTTGTPTAALSSTTNPDGSIVNTITINGDVSLLNNLSSTQLQDLIQYGTTTPTAGLPSMIGTDIVVVNNSTTPIVKGTPTSLSNANSNLIDGGYDAKAPSDVTSSGFQFAFGPGEALNGYKINIGTVSQGTQLSADVDTKTKTITINGDFVTPNAIGANQLTAVINNVLNQKGISQTITASGSPLNITGSVSGQVAGGTPQESIATNGIINFVDGSKQVYSYDSGLKSLRIPDTVYDAATDTYLKVKTFSIGKDGVITATLDSGKVAALGQIAMAQFKNPAGLTKEGGNVYSASITSGAASLRSGINTKGEDNSALYGDARQNALEGSNVDLAEQFTDMIVASRAFQANGKSITTGDEILQDIINLKR